MKNVSGILLIEHSCLFLCLFLLQNIIFHSDLISSIWTSYTDSSRFIANMLHPTPPPYPYHLLATSLHYLVPYIPLLIFFPSETALTLAILLIQYLASLLTIYLLFFHFLDSFQLSTQKSIVLCVMADLIIISPFLLFAVSEILFLFYQLLAWTLLVQRRFFYASLTAAMTFALRFNGAFFVLSFFILLISEWMKTKDLSFSAIFLGIIGSFFMFLIGFSSFIISWWFTGDFWLPLASQHEAYRQYQGGKANVIFSFPFIWWFGYIEWALATNSLFEKILLISSLSTLFLGIISLYMLYNRSFLSKKEDEFDIDRKQAKQMMIIYLCGFLGLNTLASVNNFTRFFGYTFPLFPAFPLMFKKQSIGNVTQITLAILSLILGLMINLIMWIEF